MSSKCLWTQIMSNCLVFISAGHLILSSYPYLAPPLLVQLYLPTLISSIRSSSQVLGSYPSIQVCTNHHSSYPIPFSLYPLPYPTCKYYFLLEISTFPPLFLCKPLPRHEWMLVIYHLPLIMTPVFLYSTFFILGATQTISPYYCYSSTCK